MLVNIKNNQWNSINKKNIFNLKFTHMNIIYLQNMFKPEQFSSSFYHTPYDKKNLKRYKLVPNTTIY